MILAAFALSGLSFHTLLSERTVSYSTVAAPLSRVLPELGKELHLNLMAEGDVAHEPIILSVKDAPVKDLLANIAKVAFGVWFQDGDGYALRRNESAIRAAEQARHDRLAAQYAKEIAETLAEDQKAGPLTLKQAEAYFDAIEKSKAADNQGRTDRQDQNGEALSIKMPASRAMDELLASIGADALADLPDGKRVVFSTRPNHMQRPIGDSSAQIISDYMAGETNWNKAWAEVPHETPSPNSFLGMQSMGGAEKGPDQVGKLDLIVEHGPTGLDVTVAVLDQNGKVADSNETIVGFSQPTNTNLDGLDQSDSYRLPLSPEAKWFIDAQQGGSSEMGGDGYEMLGLPKVQMPPGLKQKLQRPDLYDPLSWTASELLIGLAQHKKVQLAAVLPDAWWKTPSPDDSSESLLLQLASSGDVSFAADKQWMEVSPFDPEGAFRTRTDRRELARLIEDLADPKNSRMEVLGNYFAQNYSNPNCIAQDYLLYSESGSGQASAEFWPKYQLAFYGNLSSRQRQVLDDGGQIRAGDLSPDALNCLEDMIQTNLNPMMLTETAPQSAAEPSTFTNFMGYGYYGGIDQSESLPEGIPLGSIVTVSGSESTVAWMDIRSRAQDGLSESDWSSFAGIEQLATYIASKDYPQFAFPRDSLPALDRLRLFRERNLRFKIAFTSKISGEFALAEHLPISDKPFSLDNLPPDFKKQLTDQVANLKSQFAQEAANSKKQPRAKTGGG